MKLETYHNFPHFQRFKMPIISVTYNSSDFPLQYVARLFDLNEPTPYYVIRDELEELRNEIPDAFTLIPRSPGDDPVIVEIWV